MRSLSVCLAGIFLLLATPRAYSELSATIPFVAFYGDSQAIEGGEDNIHLKLRRYALTPEGEMTKPDITKPLTVNYEYDFTNPFFYDNHSHRVELASRDDLEQPSQLANGRNGGQLVIPAGAEIAALPAIKATKDKDDQEFIEGFTVRIVDDPSQPVQYQVRSHEANLKSIFIPYRAEMNVLIVDRVQLFSSANHVKALRDPPTKAAKNLGIHWNDVTQGHVGNCAFQSALICLAMTEPHKIKNLFRENSSQTDRSWRYEVTLYDLAGRSQPKRYADSELLTRGWGGPALSADRDEQGFEIWPQLLQRRMADMDPELEPIPGVIGSGISFHTAWRHLTGISLVAESARFEQMKAKIDAGEPIAIGTKDDNGIPAFTWRTLLSRTKEIGAIAGPMKLRSGHQYVLTTHKNAAGEATYLLINPWGTEYHTLFMDVADFNDGPLDTWFHR